MNNDPLAHKAVLYTVDAMSGMAIVATLLGFLPSIAAIAGIIWYGIQIFESKTVQGWIAKRKAKDGSDPDHPA